MKLHHRITFSILASLLAVGIATAASPKRVANQYSELDCYSMGMLQGNMKLDLVERAQKNLSELKGMLNLTKEQDPAWADFYNQLTVQAQDVTAMRESVKKEIQNLPQTAPERMNMMASRMKDRAQHMTTMADSVNVFYNVLTPEQRITFNKMQINKMSPMPSMSRMKP